MGKPPAVVIVARHGARLDVADEQWHTTSPTPYDTPLSYGGWIQTRTLGARIASLLHARDSTLAEGKSNTTRRDSATASNVESTQFESSLPPNPRKRKVVIHASPFLRCVQSSIAISAGMAQYHGNITKANAHDKGPPARISRLYTGPSRAQTLDSKAFDDRLAPTSGSLSTGAGEKASQKQAADMDLADFQRPILRVDACLGEWLSPTYYEFITAPPPSNMMVAGAKAELMRSADGLRGAKIVERDGSVTLFPGGDAAEKTVRIERERSASFSMASLASALPSEPLSEGPVNDQSPTTAGASRGESGVDARPRLTGYVSPVPTYALGHSAPIPPGYVAHARDACLHVDFQWDSIRDPQRWGDGGTYGEEWSAMHRRFRSGLANMVSWYETNGAEFDPQAPDGGSQSQNGDHDETDLILIIVTHGAGSNALIGAITNQPVLMDVGMASLTMAVRKAEIAPAPLERQRSTSIAGLRRRRSSVVDVGSSLEYEIKILASTDHLRHGADPLQMPSVSSPRLMPSIPEASRTGASTNSSGTASPIDVGDRPISRNSALGSMRRTTVKSTSSRTFSPAPIVTSDSASSGLWGAKAADTTPSSPGSDMTSTFMNNASGRRTAGKDTKIDGDVSPISAVSTSAHGLWGAESRDESMSKRRWTVGARR